MEKLYTVDKIMVYVGNDKSQCIEMIDLFIKTIPDEFSKLKQAIKIKNWDKAYEISHRIKPSMEILQIKNATIEFIELNTKIHQKIDLETISQLFYEILHNVEKAIIQIKEDYLS